MKILHVIPYFVPAWNYGGPVQYVYNLSRNLVAKGHDVTVLTTDTLDAEKRLRDREETIEGIRVQRSANLSNYLASRHKIFLSPGMYFAIGREIVGYDVVHLHEYRTIQNIFARHHAMSKGIPYLVQPLGGLPIISAKQTMKRVFDTAAGYRLLKDATLVLALTETEAEQYRAMGVPSDRIRVIPGGIEMNQYGNLPEKGRFRKRYGLEHGEKIVLYVGRIHESKGIDLLARAFQGISEKADNVRLVVVGPDDGYEKTFRQLIEKLGIAGKIVFTGFVDQEVRMEAYIDADVFVTPSFSGFPITLVEASACGLPVVITTNGDRLDWIDNRTGFVTDYDVEPLRDAIEKIVSDDALAARFGAAARDLVKQEFDWPVITDRIIDVYSEAREIRRTKEA